MRVRITKFGHACARIDHDRAAIVLDPGAFTATAAEALDGAGAVLITHEHLDHWTPEALRLTDAPIYTVDAVAAAIAEAAPDVAERVTVVSPDQTFEAGGLRIKAVGEWHAVIHPDLPRVHNSGYLVLADDQRIYHPGDALTAPGEPIDVLLAPITAPWMKVSEAVEFAREVAAPLSIGIHDRVYSDAGLGIIDGHMGRFLGADGLDYVRLEDGASR